MTMRTIATETRLLGLTPEQYARRVERAKVDALRLRREAMREAAHAITSWWRTTAARRRGRWTEARPTACGVRPSARCRSG
jgi:hypothetical protein